MLKRHSLLLFYITDGASQHFKTRVNFIKLSNDEDDLNTKAEAHFHVTSYRKGPCDDLGGNLERLATRACLQLPPGRSIISPIRLYEWAKSSLKQTAIYNTTAPMKKFKVQKNVCNLCLMLQ